MHKIRASERERLLLEDNLEWSDLAEKLEDFTERLGEVGRRDNGLFVWAVFVAGFTQAGGRVDRALSAVVESSGVALAVSWCSFELFSWEI